MSLDDILKEAKKMQTMMEDIQRELKESQMESSVAGGAVKVVASGANEVVSISIDPEFLKESHDVVEAAVLEGVQQALEMAKKLHEEKISQLTSSFKLPGLM